MTPGPGEGPRAAAADAPLDRARADTYLRLLVEAELRRVLTLPREEWPDSILPGPLRRASRAAQRLAPLGRQAADALQPLADSAARTLPPLARRAEQAAAPLAEDILRTVQPLADEARRALLPLAENAARTLQPLAARLVQTALPLADNAARRLHPRAWEAAGRVQALRDSGTPGDVPGRQELSPEEGLHRLRRVADALTQVGAIDPGTADSVMEGLETALLARSRVNPNQLRVWELRAWHRSRATRAPAGQYLAAPVGVTVAAEPDSGITEIHLFAVVIGPDKAVLTVAARMSKPPAGQPYQHPWSLFQGSSRPSATDDRGNQYQLHHDGGRSTSDGSWSSALNIIPVPPAGLRWLELSMSPGSSPVRVDLTGPSAGGDAAVATAPPSCAAERLIDVAAETLLHTAVRDGDRSTQWHDLSAAADIVTALDAVGALAPAHRAVGRLVTLAGLVGAQIPPALAAAAEPAELPAAWQNMLANRGREDGPCGVAAAAAVLPEIDGTRFALAGLRSGPAGAELHVLAWGWGQTPLFGEDPATALSWCARDDKGRWHAATEDGASFGDHHASMELQLAPALHPDTTSLEVTLACPSGQVSATVPLTWWETT